MTCVRLLDVMFALAFALGGCATKADNIDAAYVSPIAYQGLTCAQLQEEAARVSARASQAIGAQNDKATNDAVMTTVGAVVFFPTLFFIKGDGASAVEVGRLKGEMQALEAANVRKNCGLEFRSRARA